MVLDVVVEASALVVMPASVVGLVSLGVGLARAAGGIRTPNLFLIREVLKPLSYSSIDADGCFTGRRVANALS